jgi:hypothetical protein
VDLVRTLIDGERVVLQRLADGALPDALRIQVDVLGGLLADLTHGCSSSQTVQRMATAAER